MLKDEDLQRMARELSGMMESFAIPFATALKELVYSRDTGHTAHLNTAESRAVLDAMRLLKDHGDNAR